MTAAASPDAYVDGLSGWQQKLVTSLRKEVRNAAPLDESIKWGHLVYSHGGPVLLIRAEDERVLLGYWRGKRLRDLEPRLVASGKYELANIELREGDKIEPATVRELTRKAVALNDKFGDPRKL